MSNPTSTAPVIALLRINHEAMDAWKGYAKRPGTIAAAISMALPVAFWVTGLFGGLALLSSPAQPMTLLLGLYGMLAALCISVIVFAVAAVYVAQTMPRNTSRKQ